ncbi:serine-rich adhesin for platelets-like [Littorina saxatilis]|uniref:serine-rich adhesin for platelets-like n=1 Tax=Littorina saxatilis TaxID=31220 RepID=UPI0038B56AF2
MLVTVLLVTATTTMLLVVIFMVTCVVITSRGYKSRCLKFAATEKGPDVVTIQDAPQNIKGGQNHAYVGKTSMAGKETPNKKRNNPNDRKENVNLQALAMTSPLAGLSSTPLTKESSNGCYNSQVSCCQWRATSSQENIVGIDASLCFFGANKHASQEKWRSTKGRQCRCKRRGCGSCGKVAICDCCVKRTTSPLIAKNNVVREVKAVSHTKHGDTATEASRTRTQVAGQLTQSPAGELQADPAVGLGDVLDRSDLQQLKLSFSIDNAALNNSVCAGDSIQATGVDLDSLPSEEPTTAVTDNRPFVHGYSTLSDSSFAMDGSTQGDSIREQVSLPDRQSSTASINQIEHESSCSEPTHQCSSATHHTQDTLKGLRKFVSLKKLVSMFQNDACANQRTATEAAAKNGGGQGTSERNNYIRTNNPESGSATYPAPGLCSSPEDVLITMDEDDSTPQITSHARPVSSPTNIPQETWTVTDEIGKILVSITQALSSSGRQTNVPQSCRQNASTAEDKARWNYDVPAVKHTACKIPRRLTNIPQSQENIASGHSKTEWNHAVSTVTHASSTLLSRNSQVGDDTLKKSNVSGDRQLPSCVTHTTSNTNSNIEDDIVKKMRVSGDRQLPPCVTHTTSTSSNRNSKVEDNIVKKRRVSGDCQLPPCLRPRIPATSTLGVHLPVNVPKRKPASSTCTQKEL